MIAYIRADLRRILRRIPRVVVLALLYGLIAFLLVGLFREGVKTNYLLILTEHYIVGFFPLVVGLLELAFVISDDFRAKTMQAAIGRGVSRRKVVCAKLIDMAILMFLDLMLLGAVVLSVGGIWRMGMGGVVIREFILTLFIAWLKSVAYTSLALILAFYSQNTLFAILVHILLTSGIAARLLGYGFQIKLLAPLHLERFLLTTQANAFYSQLLLGRVNVGSLLAVVVYTAAGVFLTSYLFSGVELEL